MTEKKDSEVIDWMELKSEQEVTHQLLNQKISTEDQNPLNTLMFGVGLPLKTYWQNGNFNACRFEGYSSSFLFWLRLGMLIPHILYTYVTMCTNNGDYMQFFYWWTLWGWSNAIISTILTMLAAWKPEYWHVMAFAWFEASHCLNMAVTFAFWLILMPLFWNKIPAGSATTTEGLFMIIHMTILHATPLLMTSVNVYFTDIKMLPGDWKL